MGANYPDQFQGIIFSVMQTNFDYDYTVYIMCVFVCVQGLKITLQDHQTEVDYLTSTVEQVFKKAPPEMCQRYRNEMDAIMTRWKCLTAQLDEHSCKIQEHIEQLSQFQVCLFVCMYVCVYQGDFFSFILSSSNFAVPRLRNHISGVDYLTEQK